MAMNEVTERDDPVNRNRTNTREGSKMVLTHPNNSSRIRRGDGWLRGGCGENHHRKNRKRTNIERREFPFHRTILSLCLRLMPSRGLNDYFSTRPLLWGLSRGKRESDEEREREVSWALRFEMLIEGNSHLTLLYSSFFLSPVEGSRPTDIYVN